MPAWLRMGGRAVECIGLENRRLFAGSVSSNLTPSASFRQFGFSEPFSLRRAPMQKTNALRQLDRAKIAYRPFEYEISDEKIDAVSVARKLNRSPDEIFKTLVTVSPAREHFVFVIPASSELDMKAAASAAGQKRVEMLHSKELLGVTGYVHGGCSPVGMKKAFPTFIDETAVLFDAIFVSGGRIGLNILIAPETLANFVGASFAPLTKNQ